MSLPILDIPNDSRDWGRWLEPILVGPQLKELISQISVMTGGADSVEQKTLGQICGPSLNTILERGLASTDVRIVQRLLKYPYLLLDLQEQILQSGSEYWRSLSVDPALNAQSREIWRKVQAACQSEVGGANELSPANKSESHASEAFKVTPSARAHAEALDPTRLDRKSIVEMHRGGRPLAGRRQVFWIAGSLAAVLLIAVTIGILNRSPGAWGFNRPELLAQSVAGRQQLVVLAAAADEWFNRRPSTDEGVAKRIREFREGCQKIAVAEHPGLSAEDKKWLVDKCNQWSAELDSHLSGLVSHKLSALEARNLADQTVAKLVVALRTRGGEPINSQFSQHRNRWPRAYLLSVLSDYRSVLACRCCANRPTTDDNGAPF